MPAFTSQEKRAALSLSLVYVTRMMGLFLLLPVLSILAQDLSGSTPLLIGLTVGVYALFQALLQIPFGLMSDRFGRKPVILAGLAVFFVGCLVAAVSDTIWGVIVGRALQGGGAISAVIMALAADLTRDSQRTKIMAVIGASIGLSFIVSIIVGPLLMRWFELSGIFYFIALSAVFAAALIIFVVPTPEISLKDRNVSVVVTEMPALLGHRELLRIDFGILLLHFLITASFVCIPLRLLELGIAADSHWLIYLAGAIGSLFILVPMVAVAEKKLSVRWVMVIGIVGLASGEFATGIAGSNHWFIVASMVIFFGFMSVLESLLPSLVSRTAPASLRGTAMGVYSTSQFLGAFLGGVMGGWLSGMFGNSAALIALSLLCLAWLPVAWQMQNPARLSSYRLPLKSTLCQTESEAQLTSELMQVDGVEEASILIEECVAYLKVDRQQFDHKSLIDYTTNERTSNTMVL